MGIKVYTILCLLGFYFIIWVISKMNEKKCLDDSKTEENIVEVEEMNCKQNIIIPMERTKDTKNFFLETLSKIGCRYELDEDDKDILYFAYQGEKFIAILKGESRYVQIWDTHWAYVDLYDIDEFSRLRKAINLSNLNCATMTVYTIDKESGTVDVHCKSTIPFISQMPDVEDYLRCELDVFFQTHRFVMNKLMLLRVEEKA